MAGMVGDGRLGSASAEVSAVFPCDLAVESAEVGLFGSLPSVVQKQLDPVDQQEGQSHGRPNLTRMMHPAARPASHGAQPIWDVSLCVCARPPRYGVF